MTSRVRKLHPVLTTDRPALRLVNAGESHSVVGSETSDIARALSLLVADVGGHPGNLTHAQARDVLAWAGVA